MFQALSGCAGREISETVPALRAHSQEGLGDGPRIAWWPEAESPELWDREDLVRVRKGLVALIPVLRTFPFGPWKVGLELRPEGQQESREALALLLPSTSLSSCSLCCHREGPSSSASRPCPGKASSSKVHCCHSQESYNLSDSNPKLNRGCLSSRAEQTLNNDNPMHPRKLCGIRTVRRVWANKVVDVLSNAHEKEESRLQIGVCTVWSHFSLEKLKIWEAAGSSTLVSDEAAIPVSPFFAISFCS